MELLTVHETAAMLRVSPITIRRYIASGRLRAVRIGRRVRIQKDAAESLAAPVAPIEHGAPAEQFVFHTPSAEQLARRKSLVEEIIRNSRERNISPLTSADLVHMARGGAGKV